MADVNETYTVNFETNAQKATGLIAELERTLSGMQRSGELAGKGLNQASRGILAIEGALGSSSGAVKKYSDSFSNLRKEVSKATEALQEAAQAYVVGGGTDVLGAAAQTMGLGEAKEILAIRKAEGLTAEQVAAQVVAANKRKEAAEEAYATAMRQGMARLEQIQKNQTASENAESLRVHNLKMARLQEEVAKETAAAQKILAERQKLNAASAKSYQSAYTDPKSFFGQANSRDASSGLKASETSWAVEARKSQEFQAELNRTEAAFQRQKRAAELAGVGMSFYGAGTKEAEKATSEFGGSLPTLRYALYDVSSTLAFSGAAMVAFSGISLKAAIDYERSFADVIRTNDDLRNSSVASQRAFERFVSLAGELPTTFAELSEIGTLAGQLGVATARMEDFTRATAMFSAVTGESIDTTATAFGRLDALLPDVQGNYEALGSSILNVGINSVATEGEVIKITTQLAGVGRQAGLTADEVIGLSGALASVGIQPELARGTITRLFGQISRAVATGGENLQGFAAIAGTTADQFSSKWASAPMEAILNVFDGIRDRGAGAEAALRSVGITSVRDVPAILRLSQTMDSVLVPALADAEKGFRDGTQLSENYGVIAETTAAKLQILANNFQSLLAALGDSTGLLGKLVDVANEFLTWARDLQKNPVTAFFSQFVVIATGVVGVLTLLAAAVVRGAAGMIAFRTAMQEAGVTSVGLRANLTALTGTIAGVNTQTLAASGGMGRLTGLMGKLGVASLALAAIPLAEWLQGWVAEINGAVVDVNTLSQSLSTLDLGMDDAALADFKATLTMAVESLGASTQTAANSAFIPIVGAYVESVRKASYAAETEFGLGLERMGQKATSWWTTDLFTGNPTWLAGFFDSSYAELDRFEEAFIQAWESAASETQKQAVLDAYKELESQVVSAGGSASDMAYNFSDFHDVVGDGVNTTLLSAEALKFEEDALASLAGEMNALVDDVFSAVNAQYALQDALMDVGGALVNEGAMVAFTGDSMQNAIKAIIDQSGGAGTAAANLQVFFDYLIQGGYASAGQLSHLQQVIAGLMQTAGGKVSAPTLAMPNFDAFQAGMQKVRQSSAGASRAVRDVGDAAKEAREKIRTLSDYANDLSSVWKRAFEIRFSGDQSADAIADSFQKLRDAAEASAKRVTDLQSSIRSLNADMASLRSDIGVLEYYLQIAREYGDTKRATALEAELAKKRAELADKSEDLADKSKELAKEQASQNKTLEGNTQSARDNRKAILDLVTQYQAHIQALAASGLSQDQLASATERLKQDFIAQATQLGYNQVELSKYAKTFDDVRVAIANVPRNITVSANINPALQALNEFNARVASAMQSARNTVGSGVSIPISTPYQPGGAERSARAVALEAQIKNYNLQLTRAIQAGNDGLASRLLHSIRSLTDALNSGAFYTGGFTGRGGKYEVAGTVHRGEYVVPKEQVNQATGLPYASALGQMMGGLPSRTVAPAASSGGGGTATVALTAGTIQAIAQATGKNIYLDGKLIAASSSNVYAHDNTVGAY